MRKNDILELYLYFSILERRGNKRTELYIDACLHRRSPRESYE